MAFKSTAKLMGGDRGLTQVLLSSLHVSHLGPFYPLVSRHHVCRIMQDDGRVTTGRYRTSICALTLPPAPPPVADGVE